MREEQILIALKENPFFLAPMAGITDSPFRCFMREMGCGMVTTELVSARSLCNNNAKSFQLMSFTESQRPVGVQIFGEELTSLADSAKIVEQSGADFLDLNFGCPVAKIVRKGAGSAILKDLKFLSQVLQTVKKAISIPLSIKVRTGWDALSRNTHEVAQIAHNEGVIWLTVHGRTRAQAYSGQADWDYIEEVKKKSLLPIIGNGDLTQAKHIIHLKNKTQCDGMMIGRGCLKNPWIFQDINHSMQSTQQTQRLKSTTQQTQQHLTNTQQTQRLKSTTQQQTQQHLTNTQQTQHLQSTQQTQRFLKKTKSYIEVLNRLQQNLEPFYDEKMFLLQYKKFAAWYSSGYAESASFRQAIFQSHSKQEVLERTKNYFQPIDFKQRLSTAYEPSLMQGHG